MERTTMPKIGLVVCESNASNAGALTAAAALKIIDFLKLCKSEYENSQIFEYSLNPWTLLLKVP